MLGKSFLPFGKEESVQKEVRAKKRDSWMLRKSRSHENARVRCWGMQSGCYQTAPLPMWDISSHYLPCWPLQTGARVGPLQSQETGDNSAVAHIFVGQLTHSSVLLYLAKAELRSSLSIVIQLPKGVQTSKLLTQTHCGKSI